jgi:hypothetical protein
MGDDKEQDKGAECAKGKRAHTPIRCSIPEIYKSFGPQYYRMTYESFWKLHDLLSDGIATAVAAKRRQTTTNWKPNCCPPVPNGVRILSSVCLGCALRYFAGGSPYDLMVKFGILHTEVLDCVWFVVQAINKLKQFFIEYPADHNKQRQIASAFCNASTISFSSCAGAIDGILIWIAKPNEIDAAKCGVGRKKSFCGQKNKFGLNCRAVSNCRSRFLDISILYGGSSSNCIAFEESNAFEESKL